MEMNEEEMKGKLMGHAEELGSLLMEKAELVRHYKTIEEKFNDRNDELTDDIAKNPENYGFLPGEKPQNYRIRAIVRQDKGYRTFDRNKRECEYKIAVVEAKIEALKMRDADYRCLLGNSD